MNRNVAATARKQLLRRGRALLRAAQGGSAVAGSQGLAGPEMAELQEIHAALERIERGIFGRCEDCQGDIEEAWIERSPWDRLCAACRVSPEVEERASSPALVRETA